MSEQRRLAVAQALATAPQLPLMDEVMARLNPSEVRETVDVVPKIRDLGLACLTVEHVLEGSMPVADKIVAPDRGSKIAESTPAEVSNDPDVIQTGRIVMQGPAKDLLHDERVKKACLGM